MDIIKEILSILISTSSTVVLAIVAALLIYGFKFLCNKLGISLNATNMTEIIGIVSQIVKYLDQKFVDTIKKNSSDGKLTDHQKLLIKERALDMIRNMLTAEQIDFLLKKYKMDYLEDVLDILIESTLKDVRTNSSTDETIIINDSTDNNIDNKEQPATINAVYEPSENEIRSLSVCPGNCETCTLIEYCDICRF